MGKYNKILGIKTFISDGNIKLGAIPSVSLPPIKACIHCQNCSKFCYARKMYSGYVKHSIAPQWDFNYEMATKNRKQYFFDIEKVISISSGFRWHVSGDILDLDYLKNMVSIAKKCSNCKIICFTKAYEFVEQFLKEGGIIPKNFHLIISVWDGQEYINNFNLPEAHVLYKDGHTTAKGKIHLCDGNCTNCFIENKGCIKLKKG